MPNLNDTVWLIVGLLLIVVLLVWLGVITVN